MTPSEDPEPIGLPEAARRLGVHYMTAYRYVRTGRLRARVHNGVWRIEPADVAGLARETPGATSRGGSSRRASSMLERRLVAGDEPAAHQLCLDALVGWATPVVLYAEMLAPALRRIGERWASGELTVADEHRAAAVTQRVMGRLGPLFAHPGRHRGRVVLGAPAGDHHAIPVAMVADYLRAERFEVVDLGADTPVEAFVDAAAAADRLVAVGVGSTRPGSERAIAATLRALRRAVPGVPLILGGGAVPDEATATRLGADRWSGSDGRQVVPVVVGARDAAGAEDPR